MSMLRLQKMRHIAEAASSNAIQENLHRGDKHARFNLSAVQNIATYTALVALHDYIRGTALSDAGEIMDLLSPNTDQEKEHLRRLLELPR